MKNIHAIGVGILAITLFVPTFISESLLFPFITGKNLWFRFFIIVGAILFAYGLYQYRQLRSVNNLPHIFFGLFVVILLLADISGVASIRSLFGNFERMEGWFTIALLSILFALLYQMVGTLQSWRKIFQISLIPNLYILLFATGQFLGAKEIFQSAGSLRPDATLGNSSYLGGYALMYIFIIGWLALTTKNTLTRVGYGLLMCANTYIMMLTLTRGAIVGLIVSVFIMLCIASAIFAVQKYKNTKTHKALFIAPLILGMCIFIAGIFFLYKDSSFVQSNRVLNRVATISITDPSVAGRLINWSVSWEGFKERPLLGWGQDNFLYVFSQHFDPRMASYEPWYDRSHNVFFDWLIAGGILGLLAYLSLYIASLWSLWFRKNSRQVFSLSEATLWTGFLVAYFIHNFFVFDNIASYILFAFVLAYIAWKSYGQESISVITLSQQKATTVAVIIVGASLLAMYFLVYKPWSVATNLIQAMQYTDVMINPQINASNIGLWTERQIGKKYTLDQFSVYLRGKFADAAAYPLGRTEVREQLTQRFLGIVRSANVSQSEKEAWADFVLRELKYELEQDPNNPRTHQLVGNLYMQLGSGALAIPFLEKAQVLSPKKQLIMFDRSVAYQLTGDYEKSLAVSKEAYELNPDFLTAQARYIFALYRAGKDTEADMQTAELRIRAIAMRYNLNTNVSFDPQVQAARIDHKSAQAIRAYTAGETVLYQKYLSEIRFLDSGSADRVIDFVKNSKK